MNTMTISFDTLQYVQHLKAADVPQKQAEAQAEALREVLQTVLSEQADAQAGHTEQSVGALDTKTEKALLRLEGQIERLDAKIELLRRDIVIKLGAMMFAGFGLVIAVMFKLSGDS